MQSNTPQTDLTTDLFQGVIVWAQHPLTDKVDKLKKRPVLIISNELSNEIDKDYIVVPITKRARSEPFSILIEPGDVLGNSSVIGELRCNKPFTIRQLLMYEIIGVLSSVKVGQVIELATKAI